MALHKALRILIAIVPLLSFTPPLFADFKSDVTQAMKNYEKGAYGQAVEYLSTLHPRSPADQAELAYWKGLCYNRLQSFDLATAAFKNAVKLGAIHKDLHYELGQAYYASQELDLAIEAFSKSAAIGYKVTASTYYIAFSYQLKEDYKDAYSNYMKIIKSPDDTDHLKQSALLQIGEIKWALTEKITEKKPHIDKLKNNVIPVLNKVIAYDAHTPTAEDARNKIAQIEAEISKREKEVEYFANGAPMPNPYWFIRARQDLKYDSNVVTRANDSILNVAGVGSSYSTTGAYGI